MRQIGWLSLFFAGLYVTFDLSNPKQAEGLERCEIVLPGHCDEFRLTSSEQAGLIAKIYVS